MLKCESGKLEVRSKGGKQYYIIRLNLKDSTATLKKDKYKTKRIDTGLLVGGKTDRIDNWNVANELLTKAIREYTPIGADMKFSDYCEYWNEEQKKRHDIELSTKEGYSYKVRYIADYFSKIEKSLAEVEPSDIRDFINHMHETKTSKGKPFCEVTIKDTFKVVKQVFQFAQENGHLFKANPCVSVKTPKVRKKEDDSPYISEEQIEDFKAELHEQCGGNLILEYAFLVGLFYGLRREEICGLKWSAIRNGNIHIEHTVVRVNTLVAKDSAKTDASNRACALLPETEEIFRKIKDIQDHNRILFGNSYHHSDYIFTWSDGHSISPDYLSKKFRKIIDRSDKFDKRLHLHDLRATCVSILVNNGVNIKDVQKWVGHSNIQTTMNIYARTNRQRQYTTGRAIADVLFGQKAE